MIDFKQHSCDTGPTDWKCAEIFAQYTSQAAARLANGSGGIPAHPIETSVSPSMRFNCEIQITLFWSLFLNQRCLIARLPLAL